MRTPYTAWSYRQTLLEAALLCGTLLVSYARLASTRCGSIKAAAVVEIRATRDGRVSVLGKKQTTRGRTRWGGGMGGGEASVIQKIKGNSTT